VAEGLAGWSVPLRKGLAEPLLIGGVSYGFLLADAFGTFFFTMVTQQLRLVPLGLAAYLGAAALTQWEPRWFPMLRGYWRFKAYYEG